PPTRMAEGIFASAIWARTAFSGLGIVASCELRVASPASSQLATRNSQLRQESLLLQLLAIDAVRRPGNGGEALLADHVAAVGALAVVAFADPVEGLVDQHEQVALAVGEGEVELFGVGAGRLVGQILDAVVGLRIAGGLVALVGVEQLVLLLVQRIDEWLVRAGFRCFRSCWHVETRSLLTCGTECSASTC